MINEPKSTLQRTVEEAEETTRIGTGVMCSNLSKVESLRTRKKPLFLVGK
jgi:hypothetical protein